MTRLFVLLVLGAATLAPFRAAAQELPALPKVSEVRIETSGPLAVDAAYVRSFLSVKTGDAYNRVAVGRDVKALLATGRFGDVAASVEETPGGVAVFFRVAPKPKLGSPVAVMGVTAIRLSRILEVLDLQPGDWVDESLLGTRARQIRELYRKEAYADAAVDWSLTLTDTNAGLCEVALTVREGNRSRLGSIVFTGNRALSSGSLRSLLGLPARWNIWYWIRKPKYDADNLKRLIEDVRGRYLDLGYLDVRVHVPVADPMGGGLLRLVVAVEEGPLYTIGRVHIRGVKQFDLAAVAREPGVKTGDTASMAAIRQAARAIRDYYGARGFIRTDVDPQLTPAGPAVMDLTLEVREGRLTHVGDVVIRGNARTREKVIRREVKVYPGEIFNEVKVAQAERVLMNMNYFENVVGYPVATGTPGTNDLIIEVLEKPTGMFTIGAGFSSVDNLAGYMEISQGNFDLLGWPTFTGGGQRLKLSLRAGSTMNEYSLSLTEPWFLDRPLALTVEGYTMSRSYSEYDVTRSGGSTALRFPTLFSSRTELRYRLERVAISDVEDEELFTDVDGSTFTYTEEGARTQSSFDASLWWDRRDSVFVPTRGYRVSLESSVMGGPFGFDTDLYALAVKGEFHRRLWLRHVLSLRASAQVEDAYGNTDEVPLSERFYAGGPRTVRGFEYRDVGPKAYREIPNPDGTTYIEYQPRGGQTLLLASAEYMIPLPVPNIRFGGFFDMGSLAVDPYDFSCEELAWGTGVGIRLDIPGFPVRLDYALDSGVLTDRERDVTERERWSFWIGYGF